MGWTTSSSPPSSLHAAIKKHLQTAKAESSAYTPSLFWEQALEGLHKSPTYANLEELGPADLEAIVQYMSFGFGDLSRGVSDFSQDDEYINAVDLVENIRTAMRTVSADHFGVDKHQWEHAAALHFLTKRGLLKQYEEFLRPLRIKSSMSVARHFFYKWQIEQLAAEHLGRRPLDVLEIGAGAGNLAYFLHLSGLVRSYCIIDLPEMLLNSSYTISKYVPDAAIMFNDVSYDQPSDGAPRFFFIAPQLTGIVPDMTYDLCLNVNSLAEMDELARDRYVAQVYRVGKKNALFYNVNRHNRTLPQRDGTLFDNNPLLYPYRPADRVLIWEEDPFQTATRAAYGTTPSLAITRAAIINLE